jgi:hypothetical protein
MRSYEVDLVIDGNPILSDNWCGAFDFDGNDPESVIITCGDEYSKIFHYVRTMLACASGACDEKWVADDGSMICDAVPSPPSVNRSTIYTNVPDQRLRYPFFTISGGDGTLFNPPSWEVYIPTHMNGGVVCPGISFSTTSADDAFRQLDSCRQLDMGTTTTSLTSPTLAELTAPNGPNFLDLSETPTLAKVTAEYDDLTHGPVLDGQTSESYPHGRRCPFDESDLDYWHRIKIEQVTKEPARFPNDIATNLAHWICSWRTFVRTLALWTPRQLKLTSTFAMR